MIVGILDLDILVYRAAQSCEYDPNLSNVQRTVDLLIQEWLTVTNATHHIGFLTDSEFNFRNRLATTWPYKGHRKAGERPRYYEAIRDYMVEQWQAQMLRGIEADDALTVTANVLKGQGIECIIVTEDKDLLQYPGLHYNPNKSKEVFEISETQGAFNLWSQVITGDLTDNIPGVSHAITETLTGTYNAWLQTTEIEGPKGTRHQYRKYPLQELYGKVGAEKYLLQFPESEWPMRTLELYIDKYEDDMDDEFYGDLRFQETFDLIYMLRTEEEAMQYLEEPLDFTPRVTVAPEIEDMFDFY